MKKTTALLILAIFLFVGIGLGGYSALAKKKKNSKACTDSDKGINYYKKGKTKGQALGTSGVNYVIGKDGKPVLDRMGGKYSVIYDNCIGDQLNEGYCQDGKLTSVGYKCSKGCKKGACRK